MVQIEPVAFSRAASSAAGETVALRMRKYLLAVVVEGNADDSDFATACETVESSVVENRASLYLSSQAVAVVLAMSKPRKPDFNVLREIYDE